MSATTGKTVDAIFSIEAMTLSTILLMAVMVLSCSKKSDDGNGAETPQPMVQYAGNPAFANFTATETVQLADPMTFQSYLKERFSNGCVVRKNHRGDIIKVDEAGEFSADLRIGETVFFTVSTQNQSESKKTIQSIQVLSANEKFAKIQENVQSINIQQAGGEILLTPIIEQRSCVFSPGNFSPMCDGGNHPVEFYRPFMTMQGFEYMRNASGNPKNNCDLVGQVVSASTVERGSLKLQDGQNISAYRTTLTESGTIMCNGIVFDIGEVKTISIHSNDVKAIPGLEGFSRGGNFSCGGALVAESRIMSTKAGVIQAVVFEQNRPAIK